MKGKTYRKENIDAHNEVTTFYLAELHCDIRVGGYVAPTGAPSADSSTGARTNTRTRTRTGILQTG